MSKAIVEHVNLTVEDPDAAAAMLCRLFDWKVRWSGGALNDGYSVHVGGDNSYLALYTSNQSAKGTTSSYEQIGGLNHIGLVVDNLEQLKQRVEAEGMEPYNFGDYEPGHRFYFRLDDGLEVEVVKYD